MSRLRPLRLTGSGVAALALAVLLGYVALWSVNTWLLLVCCGVVAPVLLGQFYRPDLKGLAVQMIGPERAAVGEPVTHLVQVLNTGRSRTPPVLLRHRVAGFDEAILPVPPLDPGARVEVPVDREARTRCAPADQQVRLSTSAPFGLSTQHRSVTATNSQPVVVHPAAVPPLDLAALSAPGRLVAAGAAAARTGAETSGLREWQRGDSRRQVHWRATARAGRLMVTAREEPAGLRLAIVLRDDADEERLARVTWTAVAVVRSGGVVRLSALSAPPLETGDSDRVLDWFAAVTPAAPGDPGSLLTLLDDAHAWAGPGGVVLDREPG